nr:hypothetical protein [uncultured Flavobacterium sp.]
MTNTLTFSEENKGWTSFWNYAPDGMCSVDNRFYSIKNGQLYLHNDIDNNVPNTFYGVYTPSKLVFYFNEDPTNDKIFKTIEIEGTHPWETLLKTNLTQGDIHKDEFSKKESRFYAYIRKNNAGQIFYGIGTQGIGNPIIITGNTIKFTNIPDSINIGDMLLKAPDIEIGTITNIDFVNKTINVSNVGSLSTSNFCFANKPSRIEGAEIRGYYMEVEITNNEQVLTELFSVNTNAIKSYV